MQAPAHVDDNQLPADFPRLRAARAGIGAPAGVSREIVDRLNTGVTAALADPKLKARILDLGGVPMPMTPAEFGLFLAAETEKWGKVIQAANIKPG